MNKQVVTSQEIIQKIKEIDDGRFSDLVDVLTIKDFCLGCRYLNLNEDKCGRCACSPSCIGVTLHPHLLSYINWKIGWISSDTHLENLNQR